MLKGVSALLCGAGIVLLASGSVYAQTTTTNKKAAAVSDAEITSAVKTRLLADRLVGGLNIDVDTSKGIVTLSGLVSSASEKAHAIELTRRTHGVKNVVNRLTIDKEETTGTSGRKDGALAKGADKTGDAATPVTKAATDESITTVVKSRLETDKVARHSAIDINVKSGVVTISGVVPADADKARIGRLVAHTSGVKSVENNLTVK